jgi:glycosyltransferase involved in cell wall biosynthesis
MATGNGAYIIHHNLQQAIKDYQVCSYNPWGTLFPPLLYLFCQKNQFDLIHTTPDYATFFQKTSLPLVITFHNYVLDNVMRTYSSLLQNIHYATDLKWFTRSALKQAQVVSSVSQFTADLVHKDLNYCGKIRVIYNGVNINRFVPRKRVAKAPLIKVLFAGNLTRRKGANLLPDIANRLQTGIQILYASGLRKHKSLPISPVLQELGSISYDKMPNLYQEIDILLFPTVREGFGLVAAEAMASGLPVVASNCSSLPEIVVDGKGGFLCELGNAEDFAKKINLLANSPELRREMGEFNRARVESLFTEERMIKEYQQLFEEVMDLR